MYRLAYNIFLILAHLVVKIIPAKKQKFSQWKRGQKECFEILEQQKDLIKNGIWVHVASLGEFEQAKPVLESIKKQFPEEKITLTFFSPSGYEKMKDYPFADVVSYLPLDTQKNVNRFLNILSPKLVLFAKYEYWYNYLTTLKKRGIPTLLFSAVFHQDHFLFKWYGKPHSEILKAYDHIFVQNEASKEIVFSKNQNTSVAGDTRIDRSLKLPNEAFNDPKVEQFIKGDTFNYDLVIAGSTWPKDEAIIQHSLSRLDFLQKLIIAPHEISAANIERIKKLYPDHTLYSSFENSSARVLILDQIGILKYIYRYCKIAYVGGGFGKGIHNLLEPAAYGLPTLFGPRHEKFIEAHELKRTGGGFVVEHEEDFTKRLSELLQEMELQKAAREATLKFMHSNSGATDKIIAHIHTYL